MKAFDVTENGIRFVKRTNKRLATGMVKSVYFNQSRIPANMFCASDDIGIIYKKLISWCGVHNMNPNKVTSIIWS